MFTKKIGIWGCGNMAQQAHIPVLKSLENVEITAIADVREKLAGEIASFHGIPASFGSLDELLGYNLDAIFVLTPVYCHLNDVTKILEAGKNVFCEKPAAMCTESVKKLKTVQEKTGNAVGIGYMKRYDANILELKKRIALKNWGDIRFIRTHSFIGGHWNAAANILSPVLISDEVPPLELSNFDPGPEWQKGERNKDYYFSNPYISLLDTGCHSVNLLRFFAGADPLVTKSANKAGVRLVDLDFGKFNGTMEFSLNFNMNRWDEVTELYFTKASIRILTPPPLARQSQAIVEIYSEHNGIKETVFLGNSHIWAFREQAAGFIAAIPDVNDLDDAEKDIETIEQIYRKENEL